MIFLREEEAHTYFFKQFERKLGALIYIYAECFKAIRRTTGGGSGAVAVFCNLHTSCRRNERGGRGNIETVRVIATSAYDLENVHSRFNLCRMGAHSGGASRDLVRGFSSRTLSGKRCKECGVLRGRGFSAHYLVHNGVRFVIGKVLFIYYFNYRFFDHGNISFIAGL